MPRRLVLAVLLVLLPAPVFAQPKRAAGPAPETLLSADSVAYIRFDGIEPHRKAYDRTVLAEVLRGDLGDFFKYVVSYLKDDVGAELLRERVLQGGPPSQLLQLQQGIARLPDFMDYLGKQGVVVGLEGFGLQKFRYQVTLVFPEAGADKNTREAVFGVIQTVAVLFDGDTEETKVGARTIFKVKREDPDHLFYWWQEGNHIVLTIGTEKLEHTLAVIDGKKPNLTTSAAFKSLTGFNRYETYLRGFVDFQQVIKVVMRPSDGGNAVDRIQEAAIKQLIIGKLGVNGLRTLGFHCGFDRQYHRSTVVLDVVEEKDRKGLLRLLNTPGQFSMEQLPPISPDASSVMAFHFDVGTAFDVTRDVVEGVLGAVSPRDAEEVKGIFDNINTALGVDLRKDLLGALDSLVVLYNTPSEGPLLLGFTLAIKVKDAKKLDESLAKAIKALPPALGTEITVRKRDYRGATLNTLQIAERGFPLDPTYTIHKDWLVIGLFPQPVQGFVMRTEGKVSTWKPTPLVKEAMDDARKTGNDKTRVMSLMTSDPRATVKSTAAVLPFFLRIINSFQFDAKPNSFDVGRLPNAQAVYEPLFPNVTVGVDDGTALRWESFQSLPLPLDLAGIDTYVVAAFGAIAFEFLLRF